MAIRVTGGVECKDMGWGGREGRVVMTIIFERNWQELSQDLSKESMWSGGWVDGWPGGWMGGWVAGWVVLWENIATSWPILQAELSIQDGPSVAIT